VNVPLLFVALGGALMVWCYLISRLQTKPWVMKGLIQEQGPIALPASRVGLWVFLAVVTSLFGLFAVVYNMRAEFPDWRPLPDPTLLWLNTGLLILGSITLQRARSVSEKPNLNSLKWSLTTSSLLTIGFLFGQIIAWRQLASSGYFFTTNPANAFFYLLTGLHGLHLLGGLWFLGRANLKIWGNVEIYSIEEIAHLRLSVQLCSFYWHYLLLIWLILFSLLLST
jgi:cytochrome c oxidase subunit 3